MSRHFHALRVVAVEPATAQATTLRFEVPEALVDAYRWRAGQHVGVRFTLNGEQARRTYSISDAPAIGAGSEAAAKGPEITVKRVQGGLVSNHVGDHVRVGDRIDVTPPFGGFCLDPDPRARRTHYFFAAGSGITPVYAMVRAMLLGEPHSVAYLAYGNNDPSSIIFRERLDRLQEESGGRFVVRHVLSKPGWSFRDGWRRGRVDALAVQAFIDEHPPEAQDARYYVCGPGGMNAGVRSALLALGVPADRIRAESYGAEDAARDLSVAGVAATAKVTLDGRERAVPIAVGQTVLDAVRRSGGRPPFSCQSGVCGSCQARLSAGTVHMRAHMALADDEIAGGAILTCQAVATSQELALSYDG